MENNTLKFKSVPNIFGGLEKVQVTKNTRKDALFSIRGLSRGHWYRKPFRIQRKGLKVETRRKERTYNNIKVIEGCPSFLTGAKAKQISLEDLSDGDVVIATMGPTGSGKSTFIYAATGVNTGIGHGLDSCTNEVKMVKFSFPEVSNCDLVFVDMPGFDSTLHSSVEGVVEMIQSWLRAASKKNVALSGLLYFHRISDNRMAGTPLKTLRNFDRLCKEHKFKNIVITTTMWDEVDEELGTTREEELKTKYWEVILGHSMTKRFLNSRQSAFLVLEGFIDAANQDFSLVIQEELSVMREDIGDAEAGLALLSQLEWSIKEQDEVLRRLRLEMKATMVLGGGPLEGLLLQYQMVRAALAGTVDELRKMGVPIGKKLSSLTR